MRLMFAAFVVCALLVVVATGPLFAVPPGVSSDELNKILGKVKGDGLTREQVEKALGKPDSYLSGDKSYRKDNLPEKYLMNYGDLAAMVSGGKIQEWRLNEPYFVYKDGLHIGSDLDRVLQVMGKPARTVEGSKTRPLEDNVLYKNVDGNKGVHYYSVGGVKVFLQNNRVAGITVKTLDDVRVLDARMNPDKPGELQPYADLRTFSSDQAVDLSKMDAAKLRELLPTLTFASDLRWPEALGTDAAKTMDSGKNPGLGIRALHKQGITGKGVNVAIIDQPIFTDHPEFRDKIADYKNLCTGQGSDTSMHGPAVASLLVGETIGTAPGARLYYAAAPSWLADSAYYAAALDWIVEQSSKLLAGQKIRAVSVSASPSGAGSPFKKNNDQWDAALARAEKAGILVLDCSSEHGFIGPAFYDSSDRDNPAKCGAGWPDQPFAGQGSPFQQSNIAVPCSGRTTAQEWKKGGYIYAYWGKSGLSWSIPYATGVLAMGWQVNPELTGQQMVELLRKSAYQKNGFLFINPPEFIKLVRESKDKH